MHTERTFLSILIGVAVVGFLFVVWALARPHTTGIVTSVGHIGTTTHTSGRGVHRHIRRGYAADVKVRAKDTGEVVTVYYRVGKKESIPAVGDEIEFAKYALTGNGPYPEKWEVKLGMIMLALDAIVFIAYLIVHQRKT